MKAHLLFEQSGTFKNAFRKNGIEAYDYDILNDFGETDYQIDLFAEIEKAFKGRQSVFDEISQKDVVMAFFPCVRFSTRISLSFRGESSQQKGWSDEQKLIYSMKLHTELHNLYIWLCELVLISIRKGLKLVIENPHAQPHYLTNFWCLKPRIIDTDRTRNGDYYRKPTQYWFVNFEPKNNSLWESIEYVATENIERQTASEKISRQVKRSMIHPQYADRFIRQYILDGKER